MDSFTTLVGLAAPLMEDDIDTDVIFPARYLLVMEKRGLGGYLFHDRRRAADGALRGDFVLDQPVFQDSCILIAGANFGCGSSREQAVWTLAGAGFRAVIAASFGEIFYANCFKNGVLPIVLPPVAVAQLAEHAARGDRFEIDLAAQTVGAGDAPPAHFPIAADRRNALLSGRDEIDEILAHDGAHIAAFEARHRGRQPWLFAGEPAP